MRHSLSIVAALVGLSEAQGWKIGQSVKTTSGTVVGQASKWKNQVSEYLGVPFAQPPVGPLRWAAPQPIKDSSKTINATEYGYSCAESASRLSRKNSKSPNNIGASENEQSEDCLYLNIWTKPQTGEKKKAVLVWIYGGGFVVGSAANSVYNGARLADENDVIVASLNYRLSVLGFPGVPPEKNPGLLDQRIAVEWLRDNIEKFGGDPKRMVLFGQSAGGVSVDAYSFAYTKDPIVHGFIPQSGTLSGSRARAAPPNAAAQARVWSDLSSKIGCGPVSASDVTKTLDCMKSKPASAVLDATEPKASGSAMGTWGPKADDKALPSNIVGRAAKGEFIKAPILVGNTNNEGASSRAKISAPSNKNSGCSSGQAAKVRRDAGVPAWRYLYAGEFPNQSLGANFRDVEGAWHGAEIALVFGTTEFKSAKSANTDTEAEKKLSKALRDAWSAFAKDPVHGLHKLGWPLYDPSKPTVVVLGGKNSADIKFELPATLDGTCSA